MNSIGNTREKQRTICCKYNIKDSHNSGSGNGKAGQEARVQRQGEQNGGELSCPCLRTGVCLQHLKEERTEERTVGGRQTERMCVLVSHEESGWS